MQYDIIVNVQRDRAVTEPQRKRATPYQVTFKSYILNAVWKLSVVTEGRVYLDCDG